MSAFADDVSTEYARACMRSVVLAACGPLAFTKVYDDCGDRGDCGDVRGELRSRKEARRVPLPVYIRARQLVFVRAYTVPCTEGLTFARFRAIVAQLADADEHKLPCPSTWRTRFRDNVRALNAELVTRCYHHRAVPMTHLLEAVCKWDAFPPTLVPVQLRHVRWLVNEGDFYCFVGEDASARQFWLVRGCWG